jgi:hypothetical protein
MVGELHARSALRRQPVRAALAGERALGHNVEVLELLEEVVLESEGHRQLTLEKGKGQKAKGKGVERDACHLFFLKE